MSNRIAILIPYFGKWPVWIDFFIESCRANRTIDWFLFSDNDMPANSARNVRHQRTSFEEYKAFLSERLSVKVGAASPYKLCDLKPALPYAHADLVAGYDFVGFGDLDVIYGDIRAFYDDDRLSRYDVLSTHADRVSGHLCLMRNRADVVTAFERSRRWRQSAEAEEYVDFDERQFFNLLNGRGTKMLARFGMRRLRPMFREAYSTPAPANRMLWFWKDGRLTNECYPHHPFMYLHFMSWHSNRWYSSQPGVAAGAAAPWSLLPDVVQVDWRDAREHGFMISPAGIQPLDPARLPLP